MRLTSGRNGFAGVGNDGKGRWCRRAATSQRVTIRLAIQGTDKSEKGGQEPPNATHKEKVPYDARGIVGDDGKVRWGNRATKDKKIIGKHVEAKVLERKLVKNYKLDKRSNLGSFKAV